MKKTGYKKAIDRLNDFADALERGESILERFTCRRVTLDLEPTPHGPALVKKKRDPHTPDVQSSE